MICFIYFVRGANERGDRRKSVGSQAGGTRDLKKRRN